MEPRHPGRWSGCALCLPAYLSRCIALPPARHLIDPAALNRLCSERRFDRVCLFVGCLVCAFHRLGLRWLVCLLAGRFGALRLPQMKFATKIWHPNISSQSGAICLDVRSHDLRPDRHVACAIIAAHTWHGTTCLRWAHPNTVTQMGPPRHSASDGPTPPQCLRWAHPATVPQMGPPRYSDSVIRWAHPATVTVAHRATLDGVCCCNPVSRAMPCALVPLQCDASKYCSGALVAFGATASARVRVCVCVCVCVRACVRAMKKDP